MNIEDNEAIEKKIVYHMRLAKEEVKTMLLKKHKERERLRTGLISSRSDHAIKNNV